MLFQYAYRLRARFHKIYRTQEEAAQGIVCWQDLLTLLYIAVIYYSKDIGVAGGPQHIGELFQMNYFRIYVCIII